jgi:hypothetical protein
MTEEKWQEFKTQVQDEILSNLEETIEDEMATMGDFYTIAEIASEVLLSHKK